jgi:acyl transferase domain-containing protein/acyl carrier protein
VTALTRAFGPAAATRRSCGLGSLKTNVGHLDAAAGVAGLIKAALSLEREMIPPSLHFERPKPRCDFDGGPFFVNDRLTPWPRGTCPRRAGVSSFGIGGTNAHVVLEEAPAREPSGGGRPWQLLTLSAKTAEALEEATASLAAHLGRNPGANMADVAYTCAVGRRAFEHRRAVVCRDAADAAEKLARRDAGGRRASAEPRVAFMFPGQGAQHPSMGAELYRLEPSFRERVDECCEILRPHLGLNLRDLLFARPDESDAGARRLAETALAQPALFVTEYALARLWMSWGVTPDSMIGHSVGEYVAACLAGVFTPEEALPLVAARGRLMQAMPAGSMLAAPLPESELRVLLDAKPFAGRLSVAAVNAPSSCVVSGRDELLSELEGELRRGGLDCRRLDTSHAFHSEMMEPVLAPFAELFGRVRLKPPALPFISNLTGRPIADEEATDPGYWARHLRQTVRFADGVGELLKEPGLILLEVGPGRALSSLARQHGAKAAGHVFVPTLPHAAERTSELAHVLGALGKVWVAGKSFDAGSLYAGQRRRRVPLPTYPFERRPYWVDARRGGASDEAAPKTAEKREEIADWFYLPAWRQSPPPGSFVPDGSEVPEAAAPTRAGSGRCRLVFIDETGLGSELAKQFGARGEEVVTVAAGERFRRLGDAAYEIDPRDRRGYEELIRGLRRDGKTPRAVVHLWALTAQTPAVETDFEREQWRGYYSLLHLAQALAAAGGEAEVCVVSNGLHAVNGSETVSPEKATLLGPCRVIPQEYANLSCRSIDVEAHEGGAGHERESLAARLVAEIDAGVGAEKVVAYRGGRRWVQTFDAVRLGGPATAGETARDEEAEESADRQGPSVPARLRERGVYVVTGGGGAVGMELAAYLARACRARLVLLGRGTPDAEQVAGLERLGAEVMWARADVSDERAVSEALEEVRRRFGAVHGLIHAAGLAGDAAVVAVGETGQEESARQFRAKVYGLLTLERELREDGLDFGLLVSSLSSVLGGLGFAAYAAANLFMDAFAHSRNRAGEARWVSVNWDGWHFGEAGGAAPEQGRAPAILPAEGAEAFGRILRTRGLPQVVVSTTDLGARIERWVELAGRRAGADGAPALYARPELANEYEPPRDDIERVIADIWQQLLGIEGVGREDNFFDLGGHSLLATQLVSRIRDAFGVEVSLRNFFESPTVAGLAALVGESAGGDEGEELERLLEEIESLSSAEVDESLSREAGQGGGAAVKEAGTT